MRGCAREGGGEGALGPPSWGCSRICWACSRVHKWGGGAEGPHVTRRFDLVHNRQLPTDPLQCVMFDPMYDSYVTMARRSGGVIKPVKLRLPDFSVPKEELAAAFSDRTK